MKKVSVTVHRMSSDVAPMVANKQRNTALFFLNKQLLCLSLISRSASAWTCRALHLSENRCKIPELLEKFKNQKKQVSYVPEYAEKNVLSKIVVEKMFVVFSSERALPPTKN